MTSEQLLMSAVGALAAVVVFIFGLFMKKNASQDKRIDDCEADRARLNAELIDVWKTFAKAGIKPVSSETTKV